MSPKEIARRARARRLAMQAMYQMALSGDEAAVVAEQLDADRSFEGADRAYFDLILAKSAEHAERLTEEIVKASGMAIDAVDPVERALITIGACEILFIDGVDRAVAISEAVRLAKKFGAAKGYRFVNGVLDNIRRDDKANA